MKLISESNARQLAVASELVDYGKNDFAGTHVNQFADVVIVAVTDRGEELAKSAFGDDPVVRIERGTLSVAGANELGLDLYRSVPNVAAKTWAWGVDPVNSAVRVGLFGPPNDEDKSDILRFAEANRVRINVYVDQEARRAVLDDARLEDDAPFAGGFSDTRCRLVRQSVPREQELVQEDSDIAVTERTTC